MVWVSWGRSSPFFSWVAFFFCLSSLYFKVRFSRLFVHSVSSTFLEPSLLRGHVVAKRPGETSRFGLVEWGSFTSQIVRIARGLKLCKHSLQMSQV